jgi:membrane protein
LFKPSPHAIAAFFGSIPFLDGIFDEQWFSSDLFSGASPGISGIISMLSLIWAARILALSIQRGLKIVFPVNKNRNPLTDNLITFVIEAVVIIFILIILLSSRTAMRFYRTLEYFREVSFFQIITSQTGSLVFYIILLGIVSYSFYRFIPVKSPRKLSALQGALLCIIAYSFTAKMLGLILDISRYNFLYGALGNLIILLINVYFLFNFFFLGAQLTFTTDSFDALFFLKLRQINKKLALQDDQVNTKKAKKRPDLLANFFYLADGNINKNIRQFKKDEVIISQKDTGNDIYYLLKGNVKISVSSEHDKNHSVGILEAGAFFGEMSHLLSEIRCATVSANTDVSVYVMSPAVFDEALKYDTSLDRDIIEHMSRRLKETNEQIRKGNNA